MNEAMQTPITDLLARVPTDACLSYEHCPTHHQHIPFGRLAAEALAEISRLTRELAERTQEYIKAASDVTKARLACAELESRLAWRKVSKGLPTQVGVYVADNQVEEFDPADEQAVQWWRDNQQYNFWLGPLPAAPNEAGK